MCMYVLQMVVTCWGGTSLDTDMRVMVSEVPDCVPGLVPQDYPSPTVRPSGQHSAARCQSQQQQVMLAHTCS
jgi:hypothetical protein